MLGSRLRSNRATPSQGEGVISCQLHAPQTYVDKESCIILPRIKFCDSEKNEKNGSRMLPLPCESLIIESRGSILLPFLEPVFLQIFMRTSIQIEVSDSERETKQAKRH